MTVRQFADSPFLASAGDKLERLYIYVRQLPQVYWRNIVVVLSLFWICHSLAGLFWVVFPVPDIPQPARLAPPLQEESGSMIASIDVEAIQNLQLFGQASENAEADTVDGAQTGLAEAQLDGLDTTKLSLKLQGIIATEDQADARAIIANGNEQVLYSVGEELPQGKNVKLAQVLSQRVILDNNGKLESLWLYTDEDFEGTTAYTPPSAPRQTNDRISNMPMPRQAIQNPSGQDQDAVRATVRPEQIPKSINDVVRFSVHREDGKMVGYRVRPGRERELFDQVGLQANDVVTSVNGISVDDPKQVRAIYQELKTATSAQLQVRRDGQTIPINISLDTGG